MKIDYIKNQIKVAGMVIACTSLCSCNSEIEDGTTDIDSWPLPRIEVTYPTEFEHPGVVFTVEDIERFRKIATQQIQPQYAGYELLSADKLSQSTYIMNGPYDEIYAGEDASHPNIMNQFGNDFAAACQNAIMFAATQQKGYAYKSMEIIRGYSASLKKPVYSARQAGLDHVLMVGNLCIKLVYAVELMRYLDGSGMTNEDFQGACDMFKRCFIPVLDDFFSITEPKNKAVGNFGASAINCYMAMAIVLDDMEMYKKAIDIYLYGYENGSIRYYIDGETGQCQESGRDQTHAQLGLGMMSMLCETAWKQGTDLYGVLDNRLLKGYEYTAKYNLGYDVPFKYMPELTGKYNWYEIDEVDKKEVASGQRPESRRGKFAPVYERVYNHYATRLGLGMPYVKEVLETKVRPENAGTDIAHLGYGTFLYCSEGFE